MATCRPAVYMPLVLAGIPLWSWLLALLLALAALVQVNDPDPARWMALYASASVSCLLWQRRRGWILAAVVFVVASLWAARLALQMPAWVSGGEMFGPMEMQGGTVELAREFWGLVLVSTLMLVLAWRGRTRFS